ncbi:hypothetical protein EVAR_90669_1 [Eumeta japonica]|uniref:Uncharacterized protein n=1 Tax=Eumeta variegata TaxID=151549 RepID=A0A4C1Z9W7_EUMVA|nr:hypothetical protein EVAR_90669_1 [Eumeta japonica]
MQSRASLCVRARVPYAKISRAWSFAARRSEELLNLTPAAGFDHRSAHLKYHHHNLGDYSPITVRRVRNFLPRAVKA